MTCIHSNGIRICSKAGFTLMELLIAVVIFAVAATTLFSSLNTFIRTSGAVSESISANTTVRSIFTRIRLDLESVVISHYPAYEAPEFNSPPDPYRFVGEKNVVAGQEVSGLSFVSLARTDFGPGSIPGISRISYYVKENDAGLLDLYRSDTILAASPDIRSCRDPVLCRDITGFEIVYTDRDGEEFEVWDSDAKEAGFMPPARVWFSITLNIKGTLKTVTTTIALDTGRLARD